MLVVGNGHAKVRHYIEQIVAVELTNDLRGEKRLCVGSYAG